MPNNLNGLIQPVMAGGANMNSAGLPILATSGMAGGANMNSASLSIPAAPGMDAAANMIKTIGGGMMPNPDVPAPMEDMIKTIGGDMMPNPAPQQPEALNAPIGGRGAADSPLSAIPHTGIDNSGGFMPGNAIIDHGTLNARWPVTFESVEHDPFNIAGTRTGLYSS